MGVGTPENLLECIALGVDMFDCVLPTRNARHGLIYTRKGIRNMKNLLHDNDCDKASVKSCDVMILRRQRHLSSNRTNSGCFTKKAWTTSLPGTRGTVPRRGRLFAPGDLKRFALGRVKSRAF